MVRYVKIMDFDSYNNGLISYDNMLDGFGQASGKILWTAWLDNSDSYK